MSFEHNAYKSEGEIKFTSNTTPSTTPTLCSVTKGPKYVCPVIFIPGIMGSNIIHNNGDEVWFPPNGLSAVGALIYGIFRTAKARQEQLDPLETSVSNNGDINIKKKLLPGFTEEKARLRGWGTVWWTGYGKILMYLENHLNQSLVESKGDKKLFQGGEEWKLFTQVGEEADNTKGANLSKKWGSDSNLELLSREMHSELADYAFPVFALGYNWLQSNEDSAIDVQKRLINKVKPQAMKEYPCAEFKKFIIVTHSMGGLVTRSLIQKEINSDILGVVHGVMPASGAPAVYQRLSNGWDGKATTGSIIDSISALIFGHNSARLMSVLGNAPGALELLPFGNFRNDQGGTEWLRMKTQNLVGNTILANVPKTTDPYNEIYMNRDVWWRMINEDGLDPANMLGERMAIENKSDVFSFYEDNILKVKRFHEVISDSYHENCYAHYGNDENFKAFSEVTWTSETRMNVNSENDLLLFNGTNDPIPEGKKHFTPIAEGKNSTKPPVNKNYKWLFSKDGKRYISDGKNDINGNFSKKICFNIAIKPTSNGDGTVCSESAKDVTRERKGVKLKQTFAINGYSHADSYNHIDVQQNTLYCIAKVLLNTTKKENSGSSQNYETELA